MMITTPFTNRSSAKANKIEEFENVLTVLWDSDIGDQIDLILRGDFTKGGMMKSLQSHPRECLKTMNSEKVNVTHKLIFFEIRDIRCFHHFIHNLILPK